jgi:hypothetical protein
MKFMVNSGSDFGAVCNLWSILLEEICGLQAADYRIWTPCPRCFRRSSHAHTSTRISHSIEEP